MSAQATLGTPHRSIEPPFGTSGQMQMPGHPSTFAARGGTGGPGSPVDRIVRPAAQEPKPVKVGIWKRFKHWMSYPLPLVFDRIPKPVAPGDVEPANVNNHLVHIETDLVNARTAYCDALLEMAKARVEAQHQLVRYQEMQHILAMIKDSDTKSVDVMQRELAEYSGLKMIR